MPDEGQRERTSDWERWALPAAAFALGLIALAALVAVLAGREQRLLERDALVVLPLVAALAALGLLAGWRARRRADAAQAARAEARREHAELAAQAQAELDAARREQAHTQGELDAARRQATEVAERAARERERLEGELHKRDVVLDRERELNARLQQSRRAEREWNRELREQISRLQDEHGMLAHTEDVRALILRTAIQLVGAEKGMLLSRLDTDADGDLDLLVAHGFQHDPEDSAVGQRFARMVLERDETIREDQPEGAGRRRTPADDEIHSLVAIPLYLRDHFAGVVLCMNRPGGFEEVDDDLLLALGDHAGAALQTGQLRSELREAHHAALRMLTEAIAARDPLLHQEAGEMAVRASSLARQLGLDERERDVLVCAALLRDVGYLALSESLLLKPGLLGPEERAVVELHPRIGFNIVRQLPALREVAFAVLYHHERWDGAGYPAGLRTEGIPFLARALAVLDAHSAMIHDRPHRRALPAEEAVEQLVAGAGAHFDPEITQLYVEHLRRAPGATSAAVLDAIAEALPLDGGGLLGELTAPATDGLTLLGNHRAFQEELHSLVRGAGGEHPVAVVLLQLEDLPRINEEASYLAGDRLIQTAARHAQRAAARMGAAAYREGGRRIALLAALMDGRSPEALLREVQTEFMAGPAVRVALAVSRPGDSGADLIARARAALAEPAAPA